jgi:iron complex outermembrane recepter protein
MRGFHRWLVISLCMSATLPAAAQVAGETAPSQAAAGPASASPADGVSNSTAPQMPPQSSAAIPIVAPQSAAQAGTAAEPAAPAQLEEVVVTATKRSQSVRDIPSSVNVLKGDKLESIGARDLKDFINLVPGINSQDEIAGEQRKLSVRGVGPDNTTNQTVGVVVGDTAVSDPYGALTIVDPDPWDMATIEVLKGPQGSLFGATSLAGLLRYVPNQPLLQTWEVKGFAEYVHIHEGGSDPSFGAAVNMPIGNTLAIRAAAIWQHAPGDIDIDNPVRMVKNADDSYNSSGRIMALWQPLSRLTVNAWYMEERRRSSELNFVNNQNGDLERNDAPDPSPSKNGYDLSTLDVRYRFDWATLASITGYQTKTSFNDEDSSFLVDPIAAAGISFLHARRVVSTNGLQQEIRLTSPDGHRWNWLAGAYYSGYRANYESTLYVPTGALISSLLAELPPPLNSLNGNGLGIGAAEIGIHPLKAGERAVFGETNFDITSNLRLTGGGRFYRADVAGTVQSGGVASQENGVSNAVKNDGFSPKVAITYRPWTDIMFYGNATRGFQFGGFNQATVDLPTDHIPSTYKSSSLWNYEVGARTDWLHKTLRLDLTLFYLNWKDAQVSQASSDGLTVFVDNVGVVHSKGLEGTLRYLTPVRGLSIEEAASYIEARTAAPFTDSVGTAVPVGTIMPSSPELQETTSITYKLPLGNWIPAVSIVDSYQGKAWDDIAHDHIVGNYNTANAYFNLERNDLSFQPLLTVSLTNLTDRRAIVSELGQAATLPSQPALSNFLMPLPTVYNQPRTISVRLTLHY